jgi:hypothetical protein
MIRKLLVVAMVIPFVALAIYDICHGRLKTGVAAGLLAAVNIILYWG